MGDMIYKDKRESIKLSASARLVFQLGEQLISDELVALMELIKNSYDADAKMVQVNINTNEETEFGRGKITITDSGNGMPISIIRDGFLRLSTRFKEENRVSPFYKRRVLGDKGIGRLSFQRLGRYIKVTTSPRVERLKDILTEEDKESLNNYNGFRIEINWNEFTLDKDLDKIDAKVISFYSENAIPGTTIEILGIRNLNFWNLNTTEKERLKSEIFGMVNPFVKKKNSNFKIYLNIDGELYTNESIEEETIEKISDVKVDFQFENNVFSFDIKRKKKYYDKLVRKRISTMENLKFELEDNRENIEILNTRYNIDLNDWEKVITKFPYYKNVKFDLISGTFAYPCNFKGTLYASDFSTKKQDFKKLIDSKELAEDIKNTNHLDAIWEASNGLYMFRNDFRILPYGQKDWVGFTKKSQTYKNNIFKEHTISGYINIDGESSEKLVEQTNRLGIVEDEYGKNFLKLIKVIMLEILIRDDVDFREGFDIRINRLDKEIIKTTNGILVFKKIITKEEEKDEVIKQVENKAKETESELNYNPKEELNKILFKYFDSEKIGNILSSTDETIQLMVSAILDSLQKGIAVQGNVNILIQKINEFKEIDNKIKSKNIQESYKKDRQISELYDLLPMAGQGMIVEALTHELNRIESNIKSYATVSKGILTDKKITDYKAVIENQQRIIDETLYLKDQLIHLEPTYRKNRKVFENISLKEFFREVYIEHSPMNNKARNMNINISLIGDDFIVEANKGFLITVFDNLFLNSLYWLEDINKKQIVFELVKDGRVIYYDSGPGIHESIEKKLFEPFETMKSDGRGLGLYIARELLNKMNAEISLLSDRKNGRLYKFEIRFNSLLEG
jgi:signal transduction histidine kinase